MSDIITVKDEAKVLYNMYVATDMLKDGEYLDVSATIEKIVVTGKTVKVFYKNGTTNTHTGE